MKKKKVILVHINHPAVDQRLHKMSLTLQQNGYEVLQLGRNAQNLPLPKVPYQVKILNVFFKRGKLMYLEFMAKVFFFLLFHRFDILCSNDLDTLLPSYLASKFKNKPLVYDTHEFFTGTHALVNRPRTRKIWETLEDFLFPKIETVITVNPSVARKYEIKYGKKLHIIYNYPYLKSRVNHSPKSIEDKEKIRLIYQGRLLRGRGLSLMVEAMKFLPENFELFIYGNGSFKKELVAKIKEFQLEQKVFLQGAVPYYELPKLTAQADIGLSLENPEIPNYALSSPNKLFDYLMQGLPVVVADLENHRTLVNKYNVGMVLKQRNPEALAESIRFFLKNPRFYSLCSENALRASETELNWEKQESKILEIYANA